MYRLDLFLETFDNLPWCCCWMESTLCASEQKPCCLICIGYLHPSFSLASSLYVQGTTVDIAAIFILLTRGRVTHHRLFFLRKPLWCSSLSLSISFSLSLSLSLFELWLFFIDRTAGDMTGKRLREWIVTRSKGPQARTRTLGRCSKDKASVRGTSDRWAKRCPPPPMF